MIFIHLLEFSKFKIIFFWKSCKITSFYKKLWANLHESSKSMYLSIYIFTITSSLCILYGLNFLFRKDGTIVNKIIALSLLSIGYIIIASYFIRPENIIQYPHFYRTVAPVFYLLPVLSYLFVWYTIHPQVVFKKVHLLLTLPFFLQTL